MPTATRLVLAAAAAVAILIGSASCTAGGDDGDDGSAAAPVVSADAPATTSPAPARAARSRIEGFGEVAFRVQPMAAAQRCALLAETDGQRQRGLMERRDLGGYDGMLFVFEEATSGGFWMYNTPLPLSIAWFDGAGRYVSSTDMEPCLNRIDCPSYYPAGPYRYALEVPQGGLSALGVGPGAVLSIGGSCPG